MARSQGSTPNAHAPRALDRTRSPAALSPAAAAHGLARGIYTLRPPPAPRNESLPPAYELLLDQSMPPRPPPPWRARPPPLPRERPSLQHEALGGGRKDDVVDACNAHEYGADHVEQGPVPDDVAHGVKGPYQREDGPEAVSDADGGDYNHRSEAQLPTVLGAATDDEAGEQAGAPKPDLPVPYVVDEPRARVRLSRAIVAVQVALDVAGLLKGDTEDADREHAHVPRNHVVAGRIDLWLGEAAFAALVGQDEELLAAAFPPRLGHW
eukprot:CAMPEP_0202752162 /NCGR_PEP_ID=MMETSP1388-20130828/12637_1 /ASSEMBLY_ACC=CAM_ASM_000864 /TAXON_ID=37098 /ORGANISM="Isochrysis sp, Strain CCMP1244" /LENGTH=266 /DNA_ID=CAMNT_0049419847 /DNA_START=76 /DNA_END=878 /DNA_ORIENTATION=-